MADENRQNPGTTAKEDPFRQVYGDITFFVDSMVSEYELVPEVLRMMQQGKAKVELKKRYLLRAINEDWINVVEDSLMALDTCIRNPTKYIEEIEEVVPIELSRTLSPRSIQHLATHTNLISKIEGDDITPSKILNVHREETLMTYENKFVNTLINRLYMFVNRRYEIAKREGEDEQTTSMDFSEEFTHGKVTGKMHFRVEITENSADTDDRADRNYFSSSALFRRVEKLNSIVSTYLHSQFCQDMGNNFIRPPVMRTNAILKNKDLHQLLDLWMFIESYESAGYSMLIQEDLKDVDREYIKELYSTLALQYLIFRYNIRSTFGSDPSLASQTTEEELRPEIVDSLNELSADEFKVTYGSRKQVLPSAARVANLTPEDRLMLDSIDIALEADALSSGKELGHIPLQSERTEPSPAEQEMAKTAAEEQLEKIEKIKSQLESEEELARAMGILPEEPEQAEEPETAEETGGEAETEADGNTPASGSEETSNDNDIEESDGGNEAEEDQGTDRTDGPVGGRHRPPRRRDRARLDAALARGADVHIRARRRVGSNTKYGAGHSGKVIHPRRTSLRGKRFGR